MGTILLMPTIAPNLLSFLIVLFSAGGWGPHLVEAQECNCSEKAIIPHIYGGEDAPKGRFPYACSLRSLSRDDHFCGCVLVDAQHVLTAAHCIDHEFDDHADPAPFISVGLYERDNSDDSAEEFGLAKKPVIHPEWNGRLEDGYDIAVIKLDGKCNKTPISMPVPKTDYDAGTLFLAIGFGDTSAGKEAKLADTLQILYDLSFIPSTTCSRFEPYKGDISDNMFCALSSTGSMGEGDSGGPVFIPHRFNDIANGKPNLDRLVGLTSFGVKEENSTFPGVFTHVSKFRTWVDCVIDDGDADECTRPDTIQGADKTSELLLLNKDEVIRAPPKNKDPECLLSYGHRSYSLEERQTTCLGGTALTRPKCLFWSETGTVDCFYRGTDTAIHRMTIKDSVVEEIENIGGRALGDVECVITGPRSVSCFIVSEDSALWTREMKNGKWEEWYSLGGSLSEVPTCISHSGGQIDCIGRNQDRMYHKHYSPGDFRWRDHQMMGGVLANKPSVVYDPDKNLITVYAERGNHRPYYTTYNVEDEEWDSFSLIESHFLFNPLSIVDWSNRTFFFSRSNLNKIVSFVYVKEDGRRDGYFKTDNHTFEFPVFSDPDCVFTEDFEVDCFTLGLDRVLQHSSLRRIESVWTAWKPIVGPFLEAPTCFAVSKDQIRCYVRSYTLSLVEIVVDVEK